MKTKDSNAASKNDDNNKKTNSLRNTDSKLETGNDSGRTAFKKSPAKK